MDKLKDNFNGVFEKLKSIDKKIWIIIGSVVAAVIVVWIALSTIKSKDYRVLYSGLTTEESNEILGKLQELNSDYKYDGNGKILVPSGKEDKLRATLAAQGYPKSGFNYDVFKNNVGMMTTDMEKKNYLVFDLQNRLQSTIKLFDGVKDAKVTIGTTDEKKYVLDDKAKNKASVVVVMHMGNKLTESQAAGIKRLVAKSVPKMDMEDVAVIDEGGNEIGGVSGTSQEGVNKLKVKLENELERAIEKKLEKVLIPIYGYENIRISVKAKMDLNKKIQERINYYTAPGRKEGFIGESERRVEVDRPGNTAGGVAGAQSNTDLPVYSEIKPKENDKYFKEDVALKYLVNQLKEQAQIDSAEVVDLTVSLVVNSEDISDDQLASVRNLIGITAGIDNEIIPKKVFIYNSTFFEKEDEAQGEKEKPLPSEIVVGFIKKYFKELLFLLLILAAMGYGVSRVIAKKKKKKGGPAVPKFETAVPAGDSELDAERRRLSEQIASRELLDMQDEAAIKMRGLIRDFSESNPEVTAQLLKGWLKGGMDE